MLSKSPALHISHIVMGRQRLGQRVSYLVDPEGKGVERAAPETVVLKRWRRRKKDGYTFSGTRLSSTLWRAIDHAFALAPAQICELSVDQIEEHVQEARSTLKRRHLSLPETVMLRALLLDIGPERLGKLIDRHMARSHHGRSGVPDLYLIARPAQSPTDKPEYSRFVEVKKPKEQVSTDQQEEIEFMKSLSLHVRVLQLIERP